MARPTVTDVQAVDPVLTNILRSYMQADDRFVASRVFPEVPVDKDSGTFYVVDKKHFFRDELDERAPGDPFRTIDYTVSTDTYETLQWAAEHIIPDEVRANSQIPMELEQLGLRLIAQRSNIRKERSWAAAFMISGAWETTNTTATDWDDFSSGDPVKDLLVASRTISNSTGQDPNTLLVGFIVHQALVNHPDLIDRIKYTNQANLGNMENALASILGYPNYLVAKSSFTDTNEAVAFSAAAIIDDDALVMHVDPGAGVFGATGGKTFTWEPGGGLGSAGSRRAQERLSDVLQHREQWDQKVVASDMGYLFTDIV